MAIFRGQWLFIFKAFQLIFLNYQILSIDGFCGFRYLHLGRPWRLLSECFGVINLFASFWEFNILFDFFFYNFLLKFFIIEVI